MAVPLVLFGIVFVAPVILGLAVWWLVVVLRGRQRMERRGFEVQITGETSVRSKNETAGLRARDD